MRTFAFIAITVTAVVLAAALAVVLQEPETSTFEIDRERAAVAAEISSVEREVAELTGGLIKSVAEVRLSILRTTASMLDQKRTSLIRRVTLTYNVSGRSVREASDRELEDILADIAQAQRSAESGKSEAANYTGGLLHSMALMKAGIDELSVAQLKFKFYSAKYGFAVTLPSMDLKPPDETGSKKEKPVGKIVKDREAL